MKRRRMTRRAGRPPSLGELFAAKLAGVSGRLSVGGRSVRSRHRRRPDRMHAAVDVQDLPRDRPRQRRQQEEARVRHRRRVREVPAQRRLALPDLREAVEALDVRGRHGLQRAGGDEVRAHAPGAEVAREVTIDRLQRCLGDAGPVVGRPRHAGVEVQADDAGRLAALEQRQHGGRQGLQRERARLEGGDRRGARGLQEPPAQRIGGDEGDRVQQAVEAAPALVERPGDGLELVGVVDVELEHLGLGGQALGHPLGDPHPAAEAGEDDLGALVLGAARDGEGDRLVGQNAGDEQLSSFEEHACTSTSCGLLGATGSTLLLSTSNHSARARPGHCDLNCLHSVRCERSPALVPHMRPRGGQRLQVHPPARRGLSHADPPSAPQPAADVRCGEPSGHRRHGCHPQDAPARSHRAPRRPGHPAPGRDHRPRRHRRPAARRRARQRPALARAGAALDGWFASSGLLRGKLYDHRGHIAWSDDHKFIGQDASRHGDVRAALTGEVDAHVEADADELDAKGRFFEVYVPIRGGVFESYMSYEPTARAIASDTRTLLIALVGGLLLLWLGLFRIVARASRRLRHQATHDTLTGLSNRAELHEDGAKGAGQRRPRRLARRAHAHRPRPLQGGQRHDGP